ncbi:MAG TPA: pyridoxal-phosphate dependent enzyme [Thermomicrobiales bacterium]|nr:pyridoxal-phosphate dependent enzyme [Thermomicrobiales bacterium]
MVDWKLRCERCGRPESLDALLWRCPACSGAFEIAGDGMSDVAAGDHGDSTLWRYGTALPVGREHARSLGEGMTPLIRGSLAGQDVWLKNDALMPTGSFKDRGAVVLVAHLRRLGVNRLIVDSSGNAAASMAGYCAAAGIECSVFAPATTSPGKLTQSRAYGASLTLVDGAREAVAEAAQRAAEQEDDVFYASHNWHPVFVEGVKTWAMEVWEQLGGRQPDTVFVPTGGGSAFVGAHRGFQAMGNGLPALVAAQPEACAPVVAAVERGAQTIDAIVPADTIAEGTRIGSPARERQILRAVRETGGWAQAVSDDAIARAMRELWSQGLYVEPTAAVGAAAFIDAVESRRVTGSSDAVILLTGSGLKATDTISRFLA